MNPGFIMGLTLCALAIWLAFGRLVAWGAGDCEPRTSAVWFWPLRVPFLLLGALWGLLCGALEGYRQAAQELQAEEQGDQITRDTARRRAEYQAWKDANLRKGPKAL